MTKTKSHKINFVTQKGDITFDRTNIKSGECMLFRFVMARSLKSHVCVCMHSNHVHTSMFD